MPIWVKTGLTCFIALVFCLFLFICVNPDEEEKSKGLKEVLNIIGLVSLTGIAVSMILGIWGV